MEMFLLSLNYFTKSFCLRKKKIMKRVDIVKLEDLI